MALNEQEILRGVNQKDLKAWETLYASYYAALCSYADGIVKDSDTAQDIVQDTLIRIWNSDRTFPDIKELTWYLYRSTYNNALFYLRTQASRQNILRKMVAEEVELPDEQFAFRKSQGRSVTVGDFESQAFGGFGGEFDDFSCPVVGNSVDRQSATVIEMNGNTCCMNLL